MFPVLPTYAPSLTLSTASNNVCQASPVTFTTSLSYAGNASTYQWTVDGTRLDNERGPSLTTRFDTEGPHTVVVAAYPLRWFPLTGITKRYCCLI